MLIIEGPDNVGKTTAAQRICAATGWGYHHMSRPSDSFDHLGGYLEQVSTWRVFDRFHLGAFTYGQTLSNVPQNTHVTRLLAVMRLLRFMGNPTVIVYSSSDAWLLEKIEASERAEMYHKDQIMVVNEVYRWMAKGHLRGTPFADWAHDVASLGYPSDAQLETWALWTADFGGFKLEWNKEALV